MLPAGMRCVAHIRLETRLATIHQTGRTAMGERTVMTQRWDGSPSYAPASDLRANRSTASASPASVMSGGYAASAG
jgi:hypothetical protein